MVFCPAPWSATRMSSFTILPSGVPSVGCCLSPTLVRDALHRTQAMQWASRRGRRVLNVQMGAALLSGLLLTLLNCAVYLGPFLATGALTFWDCPLVTVWPGTYPWFDWTYGQYLLALLGLCGWTCLRQRRRELME